MSASSSSPPPMLSSRTASSISLLSEATHSNGGGNGGQCRARLRYMSNVLPSLSLPAVIDLSDHEVTVFGRQKSCNVVLDSTRVPQMISRQHARVIADASNTHFTLIDLHSTNGVFLNDRRIEAAELHAGDVITFGGALPTTKFGDLLPQPQSEFVYRFEVEELAAGAGAGGAAAGEEEGALSSTFNSMKTLTENLTLIATWFSSMWLVGSYLFAEEGSEEYSATRTYVRPLFDALHVPFTRGSLVAALMLVAALAILAVYLALMRKKTPRAPPPK